MLEKIKAEAFLAKEMYKVGSITRAEAKTLIMPYIEAFNAKSKEIAKKYNQRAKTISFAGFVR
jgi:hypothetical protein